MKLHLQSQNSLEWLAIKTGFIPTPLLLAHFGFMMSKIIWEAVECNVLEALALQPATAEDVAAFCQLNAPATTALLGALTGLQLVYFSNGKYRLTSDSRKWLLKSSPQSYQALMQFDNQVCYDWMSNTRNFLQTGKGLQYHGQMQPQQWKSYQNGMTDIARNNSRLVAKKMKVPAGLTTLLDIGGAQGIYANALLQKHPGLTATVFDLPQAIAVYENQPDLQNTRLHFEAGNILTDNIGSEQYNMILMANVAHHFTAEENNLVAQKAFTALKPGGSFYILEFFRKEASSLHNDMIGALQHFFFAFSSTSGLWNDNDIKTWFQQAGFLSIRTLNFLLLPGFGMVTGRKSGNPED